MSEPSSPRNTLTIQNKRHRNTSFSIKSENSGTIDGNTEKSARKFFTTWRTACDKTKDKTKELFKRTLSWKGQDYPVTDLSILEPELKANSNHCGWSVHVWTTWVRRSPMNDDVGTPKPITLSAIQREKLAHYFSHLLDLDRDDMISAQDFNHLSEKLRHFADWSDSGTEFSVLKQIQQEFIRTFFEFAEENPIPGYIELNDWIRTWSTLLDGVRRINELPFWLQQLPKVLFLIINKSGSGILQEDELKTFFISTINLQNMSDDEMSEMYKSLTANGDFELKYPIYELCFANWLLCKNPNGPGQWLFGKCGIRPDHFPIDYSALNTKPEDRERYTPYRKSNRHSIIV